MLTISGPRNLASAASRKNGGKANETEISKDYRLLPLIGILMIGFNSGYLIG